MLLGEMEEVFTDCDGILGTLEKYLPPYEAKALLCEAFQVSLAHSIYSACAILSSVLLITV